MPGPASTGRGHAARRSRAAGRRTAPTGLPPWPGWVPGWCSPEPALTAGGEPVTFDPGESALLPVMERASGPRTPQPQLTPGQGSHADSALNCAHVLPWESAERSHADSGALFLHSKLTSDQSGRPDLNRRPLDSQIGGVGVFAAQWHSACRTRRAATCGLSGRMHGVWSPAHRAPPVLGGAVRS